MLRNATLWGAFFYLVVDITAFSVILPWLPSIMGSLKSEQDELYRLASALIKKMNTVFSTEGNSLSDAVVLGGISTSVFSFVQFLSAPFIGALSDVVGRKPILLTLQVISIVSYLFWAFCGPSFTVFILFRLFSGLTRANSTVLTALVGDNSDSSMRTKAMAVIGASYSIGFTVGPLLSSTLLSYLLPAESRQDKLTIWLGFTTAALNSINLILLYGMIPEVPSTKHTVKSTSFQRVVKLINPLTLFSFRGMGRSADGDFRIRLLSLVWLIHLILYSGMESTILFLTQSRFGYTGKDQGKLFFFLGIIMTIVQTGFIKRFKMGNEVRISNLAVIVLAFAALILGSTHNIWIFHVGLCLFGFASAAFIPCVNGLVSMMTKSDQQGHVMGIFRSLGALARALGPTSCSFIFWSAGPTVCYQVIAVLLLLLASFYYMLPIKTKEESKKVID